MVYLETTEFGTYLLDYFSIDIVGGKFLFNGNEFSLGEFTKDVANLPDEFISELLTPCYKINDVFHSLRTFGTLTHDDFINAKTAILEIINLIKTVKPFCYHNIKKSKEKIDIVFHDDSIKKYLEQKTQEDAELIDYAAQSMLSYIYLVNDIVNFKNIAVKFTDFFMFDGSRSKRDIAVNAMCFFTDPAAIKQVSATRELDILNSVNLRPWVMQVPVVIPDFDLRFAIGRRLYFTRLLDFLVTEMFEGMSQGHYLWKCGVCGKYFLMTTAHNRMYCSDVNAEYGAPCANVACHKKIVKKDLKKENKKDSPIYILWQKRYSSIRKNKSTGKYSAAVSAEAKKIIDAKRDRARIDFDYAKGEYEKEMDLDLIYEEAIKNVDA